MDGFRIEGKAFCVCEELKQLAEQNKGKTVADLLRERRLKRLEKAEEEQFGEKLPWIK